MLYKVTFVVLYKRSLVQEVTFVLINMKTLYKYIGLVDYNYCPSFFRLGDQILSVNGASLIDIAHVDAVNTLKGAGTRVELVSNILVCLIVCLYLLLC